MQDTKTMKSYWWTHSNRATHACQSCPATKALQQGALTVCYKQIAVKRGGKEGAWDQSQIPIKMETELYWIWEKKRKECRQLPRVAGVFMHLPVIYTPALHMSSFVSFKSSLQEDRTKHNHSQRHKHKIIKEPRCIRVPSKPGQCDLNSKTFYIYILNCSVILLKLTDWVHILPLIKQYYHERDHVKDKFCISINCFSVNCPVLVLMEKSWFISSLIWTKYIFLIFSASLMFMSA